MPTNSSIKRFLFSGSNLALLPGYGWLDGGCWTLAEAILRWADNPSLRLSGVWAEPETRGQRRILMHVVVEIVPAGKYLDGDGLSSYAQLIRNTARTPQEISRLYVQPLCDWSEHDLGLLMDSYGIEKVERAVELLAGRLNKRFGSFTTFYRVLR